MSHEPNTADTAVGVTYCGDPQPHDAHGFCRGLHVQAPHEGLIPPSTTVRGAPTVDPEPVQAQVAPEEVTFVLVGRRHGSDQLQLISYLGDHDDPGRVRAAYGRSYRDVHWERQTGRHERVTVEDVERERDR